MLIASSVVFPVRSGWPYIALSHYSFCQQEEGIGSFGLEPPGVLSLQGG